MSIRIGTKLVGPGHPCFVVAEVGINHNGSLEIAKQLIDAAIDAGADAVKFQKRTIEIVYSPEVRAQPREVHPTIIENAMERSIVENIHFSVFPPDTIERLKTNPQETTNGDLKYALEFHHKDYDAINWYCMEKNIIWYASSWDGLSAHFVNGYNVPCNKIASPCLTRDGFLKRVRSKEKPIILSTGMSTIEQVEHAVSVLGQDDLIILHCVSNYPCRDEEVNLYVMESLRRRFPGVPVGYSGHELGILASVAAVVLGACMVERHLTLSRDLPGSDHSMSLEPHEFKQMVQDIRRVEKMRGDGVKRLLESEIPFMKKLRRS